MGSLNMEFLQEITDWSESTTYVPNHIYCVLPGGKLAGYVKEGTEEYIQFSKPMAWTKSRRKFKKLVSLS